MIMADIGQGTFKFVIEFNKKCQLTVLCNFSGKIQVRIRSNLNMRHIRAEFLNLGNDSMYMNV